MYGVARICFCGCCSVLLVAALLYTTRYELSIAIYIYHKILINYNTIVPSYPIQVSKLGPSLPRLGVSQLSDEELQRNQAMGP